MRKSKYNSRFHKGERGLSLPVLRFPNSQSDLDRLVSQMSLIAEVYSSTSERFSLDDMRDVLASRSQISSSGASGTFAVSLSTRTDRSRDPLYNQVKMMSEIYRMFGWIRSTPDSRLVFQMTHLGLTLALDAAKFGPEIRSSLIRESVLHVVFPNETTKNVGVANHRPFAWLILLAHHLDGFITRDEIIVGVLGTLDDRKPGKMREVVSRLQKARTEGGTAELVRKLSTENRVQVNSLHNYTRLPIGILSSPITGWAKSSARTFIGDSSSARGYELTPQGIQAAKVILKSFDLRRAELNKLSLSERSIVADYAFCMILLNAGIPIEFIEEGLKDITNEAKRVLKKLGVSRGQKLLFNPELQETDLVLQRLKE